MKFIFSIILCLFLINCQTENKNFIPSYDFDKDGNSSGSSYSSKNYQDSSQESNSTSNNSSSNSGYSY